MIEAEAGPGESTDRNAEALIPNHRQHDTAAVRVDLRDPWIAARRVNPRTTPAQLHPGRLHGLQHLTQFKKLLGPPQALLLRNSIR